MDTSFLRKLLIREGVPAELAGKMTDEEIAEAVGAIPTVRQYTDAFMEYEEKIVDAITPLLSDTTLVVFLPALMIVTGEFIRKFIDRTIADMPDFPIPVQDTAIGALAIAPALFALFMASVGEGMKEDGTE